MDFEFMLEAVPKLASGLPMTLQIVTLALVLGFLLAIGMAMLRLSRFKILSNFAYGYVYVFRGTPLLVQIFLIYYGLGQFELVRESVAWVVLRSPFWCTIIALTLNTTAYTSEIIRGGIQSVPWGQIEAARATGMSGLLLFRRIIFPIAIRQALPAYSNEIILMVKASSLASTVTILEITGIARALAAKYFLIFETFIVAGAIYLLVNTIVAQGVRLLERRLSPHLFQPSKSPTAK